MKKIIVFFGALVLAGVFGGCASMSRNQCLQADWYAIGIRDGRLGKPATLFQSHYDACLKFGVQADRQAYDRGRNRGLRDYCTYGNGLAQGRKGKIYRPVCPPELEADFLAGFEKGKRIFRYESRIAVLESQLQSIDRRIRSGEKELYAAGTSERRRIELRRELEVLDLQYREISSELKRLQENLPPQ